MLLSERRESGGLDVCLAALQVDTLSAQLSELQDQVKDVPRLQTALEKANREQATAEQKLHVAVHENQQIQEQVRTLVGSRRI